jgi:hypothetical protein
MQMKSLIEINFAAQTNNFTNTLIALVFEEKSSSGGELVNSIEAQWGSPENVTWNRAIFDYPNLLDNFKRPHSIQTVCLYLI